MVTLNIGPQHPAVHGVLRLYTELNNEQIIRITPEIGYLHRGTEKLCEYQEFLKILPFFDRTDYVGLLFTEFVYVLVLEQRQNLNLPLDLQIKRNVLLELFRVSSHILSLTTAAMDLGVSSLFVWLFEEREQILEFFEQLCGARMHTLLLKPGLLYGKLFCENTLKFLLKSLFLKCNWCLELFSNSPVFQQRLDNTVIIDINEILTYAVTGPIAKSVGILHDKRLFTPYDIFKVVPSFLPTAVKGDNLSRFLIRFEELYISINLIYFLLECLEKNNNSNRKKNSDIYEISSNQVKWKSCELMERIIKNFRFSSKGEIDYVKRQKNIYTSIESPRGEFGLSLVVNEDNLNRPYRIKLRTPGFYNLASINIISKNFIISDVISYLSTIDLILGEVDR